MHRIACPFCGPRDEVEFRYRGDATKRRPDAGGGVDGFMDYVYMRDNPLGRHAEWWQHVHGCRQILKVVRDTSTHDISSVDAAVGEKRP
ncbi:MAG: sarcosine oxidase subunit delta [Proteobacteria bacterium]|nr:sarcosine oxidase subunit delta [Pseudomonadota bacterium]